MVESARRASASPGAAASCGEEDRDAPAARADVPVPDAAPIGPAGSIGPAASSVAVGAVGVVGGIVMPPCSTDQATTAQAPDCNKKAAETVWRSRESGFRVRWRVSAIDYTWFCSVGQTNRT